MLDAAGAKHKGRKSMRTYLAAALSAAAGALISGSSQRRERGHHLPGRNDKHTKGG